MLNILAYIHFHCVASNQIGVPIDEMQAGLHFKTIQFLLFLSRCHLKFSGQGMCSIKYVGQGCRYEFIAFLSSN